MQSSGRRGSMHSIGGCPQVYQGGSVARPRRSREELVPLEAGQRFIDWGCIRHANPLERAIYPVSVTAVENAS
jgi:hypothetical protein